MQSALVEFGAKGFDGASTRGIALRVEAHQPQINYHFESKEALWTASVDYLFGLLGEALDGALPANLAEVGLADLASAFADGIGRFVRFAAEHPELNQIMVHEGTAASDRLTWITETHIKPFFDAIGLPGGGFVTPAGRYQSTVTSSTTCWSARRHSPMSPLLRCGTSRGPESPGP